MSEQLLSVNLTSTNVTLLQERYGNIIKFCIPGGNVGNICYKKEIRQVASRRSAEVHPTGNGLNLFHPLGKTQIYISYVTTFRNIFPHRFTLACDIADLGALCSI